MKICTLPFKDKIEYAAALEKYSKIKDKKEREEWLYLIQIFEEQTGIQFENSPRAKRGNKNG